MPGYQSKQRHFDWIRDVANLFFKRLPSTPEKGIQLLTLFYDCWASVVFVHSRGRFANDLAGIGICSGCLLWGAAASFGLSALLAVSGFAYNVLRIFGAIYLGYLGIKLFIRTFACTSLSSTTDPVWKEAKGTDGSLWFKRGLLTNLLNPKVGVFYLSFLPQFIPAGVHVGSFSMLLALIHATEGILWFLPLANSTELLSSWLRQRRVVVALDSAMGAIFITFGLKLAFDKAR
jgi:threonine/homoserine/homoserine lactone efflux protein